MTWVRFPARAYILALLDTAADAPAPSSSRCTAAAWYDAAPALASASPPSATRHSGQLPAAPPAAATAAHVSTPTQAASGGAPSAGLQGVRDGQAGTGRGSPDVCVGSAVSAPAQVAQHALAAGPAGFPLQARTRPHTDATNADPAAAADAPPPSIAAGTLLWPGLGVCSAPCSGAPPGSGQRSTETRDPDPEVAMPALPRSARGGFIEFGPSSEDMGPGWGSAEPEQNAEQGRDTVRPPPEDLPGCDWGDVGSWSPQPMAAPQVRALSSLLCAWWPACLRCLRP